MLHLLLEELSGDNKFLLIVFVELFIVDSILICISRELVLSFFISRGNRKRKKLLHSKQSLLNRVSLN